MTFALAVVAQLVGASSYKPKDHGFNSRSGHMPGLQCLVPNQGTYGSQPTDVSLTLIILSLCLPSLLSGIYIYIYIYIYPQVRITKHSNNNDVLQSRLCSHLPSCLVFSSSNKVFFFFSPMKNMFWAFFFELVPLK